MKKKIIKDQAVKSLREVSGTLTSKPNQNNRFGSNIQNRKKHVREQKKKTEK